MQAHREFCPNDNVSNGAGDDNDNDNNERTAPTLTMRTRRNAKLKKRSVCGMWQWQWRNGASSVNKPGKRTHLHEVRGMRHMQAARSQATLELSVPTYTHIFMFELFVVVVVVLFFYFYYKLMLFQCISYAACKDLRMRNT